MNAPISNDNLMVLTMVPTDPLNNRQNGIHLTCDGFCFSI